MFLKLWRRRTNTVKRHYSKHYETCTCTPTGHLARTSFDLQLETFPQRFWSMVTSSHSCCRCVICIHDETLPFHLKAALLDWDLSTVNSSSCFQKPVWDDDKDRACHCDLINSLNWSEVRRSYADLRSHSWEAKTSSFPLTWLWTFSSSFPGSSQN